MTRHTAAAATAVSAPLTTALRSWLALGLAALALLPAARGHSLLLGWLPFWLVLAPLLGLVVRPLCYWLDRLDLEKSFTTGYTAVFVRPAGG